MALYVIAVVCSIARNSARFIASCLYIVVIFCFVCLLRFLAPTRALCFIAFWLVYGHSALWWYFLSLLFLPRVLFSDYYFVFYFMPFDFFSFCFSLQVSITDGAAGIQALKPLSVLVPVFLAASRAPSTVKGYHTPSFLKWNIFLLRIIILRFISLVYSSPVIRFLPLFLLFTALIFSIVRVLFATLAIVVLFKLFWKAVSVSLLTLSLPRRDFLFVLSICMLSF